MGSFSSDSFPCLICGMALTRAFDEYEAQPDDAVMGTITGNYGSTVFDPFDGTALAFNVCDECLVKAGEQGRIFAYRAARPVEVDGMGIVGWEKLTPVYVPWTKDLPGFDDRCSLESEDLDNLPDNISLNIPIETLREWLADESTSTL